MGIKRYFATQDNTISNAFKNDLKNRATGSNAGASDILEAFVIHGQTSASVDSVSAEQARILLQFDMNEIVDDIANGVIPSSSVDYILKMYNAPHADTICDLDVNEAISATPIDPPTMSITITVNTSPLAGKEGKKLTSTQIRDRLLQEAQNNVGINFEENDGNDSFVVSGRGELMLEILLTQMRREGFEMTVSPPKVLYQKGEDGKKLEPIEEITMDLDEEYSSKVIDSMNRRKGKLIDLKDTGKDKKRLIFHAPTRGLMGYTSRFLTLTKGNGVINRIFHSYGPFEGEMEGRRNGALIAMEQGKAVAFAIFNLQARGEMFVTHNDPVYPGMIVGLSPKPGDMIINVMKGKKLTNMRTQGTDENVVLTPVRKMSIAEQLSMLNTDEALEITPESCRLRKSILDPHERKRSEKSGAAA